MTDVELVLIAAVAEDGTIGDDGAMPWHYAEDLAHFKRTTMGAPVILGRRTYDSIVSRLGTALPGRTTIVLTRQPPEAIVADGHQPAEGSVVIADSVETAIEAAAVAGPVAFVAGGATVYEQFLPEADRMIITEVPGRFDGDTTFPEVDWSAWDERSRQSGDAVEFVEYVRRSTA